MPGTDGSEHLVWAISWLSGRPLGATPRRSPELLEDFGRSIGALDQALADFDTPAIHRDFYWDLANGRAIVARYRGLVADAELGRAIDALIGEIRSPHRAAALFPAARRDPRRSERLQRARGRRRRH